MLVTPAPIGLLIVLPEPGKRLVFTVVFFRPHAIGAIFTAIPLMVVIMLRVVGKLERACDPRRAALSWTE